jgi:hypothetical protein
MCLVSDVIDRRPLVGRRFLRWSAIVFMLLLPFALHAVWGYVEARRLTAAIEAIEAKGEPTRRNSAVPTGDAARAERLYRAAAALVSGYGGGLPDWFGEIATAERTGHWTPDLVARVRSYLPAFREALDFMDRAAPLPFTGIGPGYAYNYMGGDIGFAVRLTGFRGIVEAAEGDGDAAARSLYSAARGGRSIDQSGAPFLYGFWFASAVPPVLQQTRPTEAALAPLAQALADADHDDVLRNTFLFFRMTLLQSRLANPWFIPSTARPLIVVNRPLATHRLVTELEAFERLLAAASAPWPDRIEAISSMDTRGLPPQSFWNGVGIRERLEAAVSMALRPLMTNRAIRIAVAVERYRREHGEMLPETLQSLVPRYLPSLPIDPYTGQPMRFVKEEAGYVAYSVGPNRRDDGGDVEVRIAARERTAIDPGIRIRYVH